MSGCPFRASAAGAYDSRFAAQKEADLQWIRNEQRFEPVFCHKCNCWHAVRTQVWP